MELTRHGLSFKACLKALYFETQAVKYVFDDAAVVCVERGVCTVSIFLPSIKSFLFQFGLCALLRSYLEKGQRFYLEQNGRKTSLDFCSRGRVQLR